MSIPSLDKWNVYDGGSSGGGKNSYDYYLDDGGGKGDTANTQYSIRPTTTKYGRFSGYVVSAWSPQAGHAHKQLGIVRDPRKGVTLARAHYTQYFGRAANSPSPKSLGRRANPYGHYSIWTKLYGQSDKYWRLHQQLQAKSSLDAYNHLRKQGIPLQVAGGKGRYTANGMDWFIQRVASAKNPSARKVNPSSTLPYNPALLKLLFDDRAYVAGQHAKVYPNRAAMKAGFTKLAKELGIVGWVDDDEKTQWFNRYLGYFEKGIHARQGGQDSLDPRQVNPKTASAFALAKKQVSAYYTSDLADAVGTAKAMAEGKGKRGNPSRGYTQQFASEEDAKRFERWVNSNGGKAGWYTNGGNYYVRVSKPIPKYKKGPSAKRRNPHSDFDITTGFKTKLGRAFLADAKWWGTKAASGGRSVSVDEAFRRINSKYNIQYISEAEYNEWKDAFEKAFNKGFKHS